MMASSEEAMIALKRPSSSVLWLMSRATFEAPTIFPVLVMDRRNRDGDGYRRAILAHANGFEVINSFAALEAFEDFGLFSKRSGGKRTVMGFPIISSAV